MWRNPPLLPLGAAFILGGLVVVLFDFKQMRAATEHAHTLPRVTAERLRDVAPGTTGLATGRMEGVGTDPQCGMAVYDRYDHVFAGKQGDT